VYYYGLPANLALAAVTTLPAQVLGLEHRVGYIKEGQYTIYHWKRFMNTDLYLFYSQAGTLVSWRVPILISINSA